MKSWGLTFSFAWIGETACHWTLQFALSVLSFPSLPCLHCPGFLWVAKAWNYRLLQHQLASALGTSPLPSVSFIKAVACFCWEFLHLPHKLDVGCLIINICQERGDFCYVPAMDTAVHIWRFRNSDG